MDWEIEVTSTEYVPATVTAPHDPTGLTVSFAFTATRNSNSATWVAGVWDGSAVLQKDGSYKAIAQCLIGPELGDAALPIGVYFVHVKVTDNPEAPVKTVGLLKIY